MGARRDDDPGALEALLLAPVGVGAATPAELQRLQDRLRRREAALRAVLEGLPDATVAAGSDGKIVFATAHGEALAKVQRQSRQVAAVAALGERALAGADVGDLATEAVERLRETLPLRRAVVSRDGAELASCGDAGGTPLTFEIRTR